MSTINNLVQASKSLINAASSTVSVSAQLVADGAELMNKGIPQAPKCAGAVLGLPFSTAKGYLIQEGATEEEADARAYKYVRQELSVTIEEIGVGSGKLLADLLKEDAADVSDDITKEQLMRKSKAELVEMLAES